MIAVLLLLAALLLPVFSSSVESSQAAVCISNFRQVSMATVLYADDYQDRLMPVQQLPGVNGNSHTDRTWVQLVLPYTNSFRLFRCPADGSNPQSQNATFDQDLVPGDTFSAYYTASLHVNLGYNYEYLAPIVKDDGVWVSSPKATTEVVDPSRTLLFVDSISNDESVKLIGPKLASTGGGGGDLNPSVNPKELWGGSWLVVPPCRFENQPDGSRLDTFTSGSPSSTQVLTSAVGWTPMDRTSRSQYGGAWPRHFGKLTVSRLDGSAALLSVDALSAGCEALPGWSGTIRDRASYLWTSQ